MLPNKPVTISDGGLVCSASPFAAASGIAVLKDGGNAFDAAIAIAAVEGVTMSPMCGLGGEVFALLYHAETKKLYGLTGSGMSPKIATKEFFKNAGYTVLPEQGPLSVAMPGEVSALETIHSTFGTKSMPYLLKAAIELADQGYPIPRIMARYFKVELPKLKHFNKTYEIFTKNGEPYEQGDIFIQKALAKTLRKLAENGLKDFYTGELRTEIFQGMHDAGCLYDIDEFGSHETILYENPISISYHGYKIFQTSLPSQGLISLEMLNILEGFDLQKIGLNSTEYIHIFTEAKKLAYADRLKYMGDIQFTQIPESKLLSKEFASQRRKLIDHGKANTQIAEGLISNGNKSDNTSYFCVTDRYGNAVSFIHSLSHFFGSGVIPGNTGFILNNRVGRGFSLEDGHPNILEPVKKTMHTLNAYMIFKNGKPHLIGGTPGGDSQPQWNVQVITAMLDFGLNVQEAAEIPRWSSSPGTDPSTLDRPFRLQVEYGIPDNVTEKLTELGHHVERPDKDSFAGAVQLIMFDDERGIKLGGSDPRADGQASIT